MQKVRYKDQDCGSRTRTRTVECQEQDYADRTVRVLGGLELLDTRTSGYDQDYQIRLVFQNHDQGAMFTIRMPGPRLGCQNHDQDASIRTSMQEHEWEQYQSASTRTKWIDTRTWTKSNFPSSLYTATVKVGILKCGLMVRPLHFHIKNAVLIDLPQDKLKFSCKISISIFRTYLHQNWRGGYMRV